MRQKRDKWRNIKENESALVSTSVLPSSDKFSHSSTEIEHALLKEQIEGLKTSLERAQLQRRRKIEYDVIAEKVNALPSREELETCVSMRCSTLSLMSVFSVRSIMAIENDIVAIKAEHDNQTRVLQAQQTALEVVISSIQDLRIMGKQDADATEISRPSSPTLDVQEVEDVDVEMEPRARAETGEIPDEQEDGEGSKELSESGSHSKALNPAAKPFLPHSSSSRLSTPLLRSNAGTPLPASESGARSEFEEGEDDDIEMGELAEEPKEKAPKKQREEELEEGEASDLSSELSEPPDD